MPISQPLIVSSFDDVHALLEKLMSCVPEPNMLLAQEVGKQGRRAGERSFCPGAAPHHPGETADQQLLACTLTAQRTSADLLSLNRIWLLLLPFCLPNLM